MAWPPLDLPIRPVFPPMEAKLVDALPAGERWLHEPKWDGFRCLAFKDGASVALQSKAGQPLGRYFPEVVAAVAALAPPRLVLDGEIAIPVEGGFGFEPLLQRIHPAASRIARLSAETPAVLLAFDLLFDGRRTLVDLPLAARRAALEALAAEAFAEARDGPRVGLTPATRDRAEAEGWLRGAAKGIDGVVSKDLDGRYESGERAMRKVKLLRTADCVVGGFRRATGKTELGSLLLGLYDAGGRLHYIGHASSFDAARRAELTAIFEPLSGGGGFTGDAPGGPSRWARGEERAWVPVAPVKVVEVEYHHASGGRFRHGTRLLRFRPDREPRTCTFEQLGGAIDEAEHGGQPAPPP
jgi:ATP-dependent DNA ligase